MTATLIDWDALAAPEPDLPPPETETPDKTPDVPKGHCQGCGEYIIRPEGARGRAPKYHPECRPKSGNSAGNTTARGANTKAIREADEAIAAFKSQVTRGLALAAAFDPYSAFSIMVSLPNFCNSLHGVLVRYEGLRKEFLTLKTGGSIIGLIISAVTMTLPIMARYGLIPGQAIAKVLYNLPYTLHAINQKMANSEETLTDIMQSQVREHEARKRKEQERVANANATSGTYPHS